MKKLLNFEAVAEVTLDYAIAAINDGNGLFKVNLHTGGSEFICTFPDEKRDKKRLFCSAVCINNLVVFIPNSAENINIYDVIKNKIDTIRLKKVCNDKYPHYKPDFKFADYVLYQNRLFLLSATYPAIIKIDLDNNIFEYLTDWVPSESFFFRKGKCIDGKFVFVPSSDSNHVLILDMENDVVQIKKIGNVNRGYWSMVKVGESFWLAPKKNGPVIKWSVEGNQITEYNHYPPNYVKGSFLFTKIYAINSCVYLIPGDSHVFVEIDTNEGIIKEKKLALLENNVWVDYMFELDQYLYLRIKKDNSSYMYIRIDMRTNYCEKFVFYLQESGRGYNRYISEQLKATIVNESYPVGIQEFVNNLFDKE